MPVPIIALAPCAVITLVSAGCAYSQYERRCKERAVYRQELEKLERSLAEAERKYKRMWRQFGKKNRQVRALAAEIERLRRELTRLRPHAA